MTCVCAGSVAAAQCRVSLPGTVCVVPPRSPSTGAAADKGALIGSILTRGSYQLMLNSRYYGLPPVADGWVYMRIGDEIYRVDWVSHEVLERVTDQASRNFP